MSTTSRLLLRLDDVLLRVGLSRSTVYRLVAAHQFPTPVRLGTRSVAWRAEEVQAWIESRPSVR
ncbi:helix-turn-helix transcriptional regulator [Cupriavidus metallidurans]|uniref:helix-turn-helix transcriptional regulator n=1 Tax=Cupriavidus metallidurans TaxID=119219 RepID=UPI001BFC6B7A|nr:AlpA family phage regulatory protein [Cupriavidus metallidurans]QWC88282.1 AlpA family phage regulatory protein [Cupriavidus metallidurans]